MDKITKLTKEQISRFPEFISKWIRIGLSTEPCNRFLAEDALRKAYKIANLKPPEFIVWMDNPKESILAWALILSWVTGDQVRDQVIDQVSAQVRDQVSDQVSAQVRDQVIDQVSDQVIDQVSAQVSDQVRNQVIDQVRNQVIDQVRNQVIDQVRDQVSYFLNRWYWWIPLGNQEWWLSWINFFSEIFDIHDKRIDPLMKLAEYAHWYFPMLGIAVMCERPIRINRDEKGALHSTERAAIEYTGLRLYFWHGVSVPERAIMDIRSYSAREILKEENAEVRRALMSLYGFDKILPEVKAKKIDQHSDKKIGELWSFVDSDGVEVRVVKCMNGTPNFDGSERWYFLRVPVSIGKNVIDANRWTYPDRRNMSREDYVALQAART